MELFGLDVERRHAANCKYTSVRLLHSQDFDRSLRQRNALWGYRDVDDLKAEAVKHGLVLDQKKVVCLGGYRCCPCLTI